MTKRRAMQVTAVLGLLLVSLPSVGQSDTDKAAARQFYQDGSAALEAKDYPRAVDLFTRAKKLYQAPTIGVGLARAQVGVGKLVEARESYNAVIRAGVGANAPPAFQDALANAQREIGGLDARIGALVITVSGPATVVVTVDGDPMSSALLGAQRPSNPGSHVVEARADGFVPASVKVSLGEGKTEQVALKLTATAAGAPAASERSSPADDPKRNHVPSYVAFGVGGAGVLVGVVAGVVALGERSDLKSACPTRTCVGTAHHAQIAHFDTTTTISTVGFVVAGAGAIAGGALWLWGPTDNGGATATAFVGPRMVGVNGSF